ncbi:TPA: hypothetical protein CPT79_04805 [Candidatus Gastranaerophilales bacterium HUM_6]|jgi:uncharacterized protein YjgD (DUF1641 family)|nr:unknown [Fusobacterium sp. CAG:815]DAA90197.1 MAG TPA: hypothetical protein CPT93_09025 [Candidatus Gastranaerophilales bacterium HUM_7]DAA91143.1 MAG TPA: hypothetical protein CPT79_04805 [Candidatus Gastranaerophilales bacterium HUM_6]DAB04301.1 MAG TPA: hypothetical protein CPT84_00315 [Candidatus Gastranaerophilales bacterium HUM_12]DAB06160.1 MAG TPA: hypothetical protein CPT78_05800 [Candidatus Gastranaerophilales bacterium HUM_14]
MIPKITASTVYSKLGDNSSLVPLAIKDIANSCGLTAASYMSGDNAEGKDRFIDEFGTQAIWLWGIPVYKKLLDIALFKQAKLDPEVDARILKNKDILQAAKEMAPTESIKNSLKAVAENQSKFKALTVAKFAASTILTAGTYLGLTKFRHNYTESKIKKDYFEKMKKQQMNGYNTENIPFSSAFSHVHKQNKNSKNVAFTGGVQDFIFDPVKNLMLVDGAITGERLTHAKNPQDFLGYVIKEGFFWAFMYFAGPTLSKALEKFADQKGKSIDLDSRVIFGKDLEKAFNGKDSGIMPKQIQEFKKAAKSDLELYKFAVKPENKNLIIKMAKDSGIITLADGSELVDTRKYIDLKELRGICDKAEKLFTQYKKSEQPLDEFLKSVRSLKKASILKNIGACIGALGIIAPAIMLGLRKLNPDYQVRKDIEKKLANQQA